MYLDFYLEDGAEIAPHKSYPTAKNLDSVITYAIKVVKQSRATSGYVGIYAHEDGRFIGFIIKTPGQEPYFDDDENVADLTYRFAHV